MSDVCAKDRIKAMDYICHYRSPLGGITLASDGISLIGLWFDGQKYYGETLGKEIIEEPLPVLEETMRWLDIYFTGKAPAFTPPLSMRTTPSHSSFPATASSVQTAA